MSILFDSAHIVNPASFGLGLLRSTPVHHVPYSSEDEAWYLANVAPASAADSEPTDAEWEAMAEEAAAADRLERGIIFA